MAEGSILERVTGAKPAVRVGESEPESESDDLGMFGWLRGARDRAIMLQLQKKTGNIQAIGYSWLQKIEFDSSVGITLWFPGQKILIVGRNLNAEVRPNIRLFEGLARHRVPWIREADPLATFRTPDNTTFVERIDW